MNLEGYVPVKGYEKRYLVSPCGDIYSIKMGRLIKKTRTQKGYLSVELWADYKRKVMKVHRLVAQTFIPNPNGYKEVNHLDGNKENNHVDNLEWCTRSENLKHAYKLGLRTATQGERNGRQGTSIHT